MKLLDLFETPISSITLSGSDSDDNWADRKPNKPFDGKNLTSFSQVDQKLLQSQKAQEKIIRMFNRTPFDFEVHFINTDIADAETHRDNNDVDKICRTFQAGIHDHCFGIKGEPNKIKVLMLANLSPLENKLPMTGWTLAHKIGHSIQDHIDNNEYSKIDDYVKKIYWLFGVIIHYDIYGKSLIGRYERSDKRAEFRYVGGLQSRMTMKSAREDKLNDNSFETFAELIAQYLITGKITLKLKSNNKKAIAALKALNNVVFEMFKSFEGKVLVEF